MAPLVFHLSRNPMFWHGYRDGDIDGASPVTGQLWERLAER